ncbi:MAG: DNA polymerase II [Nanobdellota archaeon]
MHGYIVYGTYRITDETPIIHLYGRFLDGKGFLAKVPFRPYLYIPADAKVKTKEKTNLKDFSGKPVAKVYAKIPSEIPELRKGFEEAGITTYEADIRFVQRYYIDHDIQGIIDIEGKHTEEDGLLVFDNPTITPKPPYEVKLKTLALDIETDKQAKQIYSVSLVDHDINEVHIISDKTLKQATPYADEASLLKGLIRRIQQLDPDIITGWNVIDFDFKVIRERCRFHEIPLNLGRNKEEAKIRVQHDFFRESSADIPGRIVFDGISLLKQGFYSFEDYKLDTVASEILGENKVELEDGFWDNFEEIIRTDPQKIVDYNLKDSQLVIDILKKTKIIELMIKKSLITGLQLDRVKGSIAALDSLYIRKAHKHGYVCPNAGFDDSGEKIKGAYVMTPKPGIYENVAVLDFKSLYPSIIRTFNIDPIAHSPDGTIVAPNNARFRNDEGILPKIIVESWKERDKAKKEKDEVKSQAIKTIMNSFYGVLANPTCRFYSLEMANAITAFARDIIKETVRIITDKGYTVLYGDTDSVFVDLRADERQATKLGNQVANEINTHFREEIKRQHDRTSILELEFEKMFRVLILPRIRGKTGGAKKRYAGLLLKDGKEQITVTGMELVRRDWTDLAKEFQMELLKRVFHKKEVSQYIKDTIKNVRQGKFDHKLVYRKSIRKDLDEYTKTTPPHVKAARKLPLLRSNIITYLITVNGPEPLEKLESEIDYEHYIDKQLRPIAQTILELYDVDFDELMSGTSQKSLFDY